MRKSEKPFYVANLSEQLKAASSVVLVDYTGLTVKMQQDLKKRLREIGAEMSIVKNTLFRLAMKQVKSLKEKKTLDTLLVGPTAMIITEDDAIAPLQILHKFALEHELPQFKVGIVEGSYQDKDALEKLAKLPSKGVLAGLVVGSIAQPMYGLVGTLQGNLDRLVYILKTKSEQSS